MAGRPALLFAAAAAGLVASTIFAPLTALASDDAACLVLGSSSNCPLCNSFSPLLFSTTKRNLSPLLRISIFPAIIVLLVVIGIRVYAARSRKVAAGVGARCLRERGVWGPDRLGSGALSAGLLSRRLRFGSENG